MGGGSIYILPYLSTYLYIPMKDAMHLDNMQIGLMGSAMGIASMIFYWPGGWVADHFSPRKLAIGVISWVCLPETGATSSTASKNKGTIPLRSAISQVVRLPVWLVVAKTQCSPFRDENNEEEARVSTKATRSIPQR